MILAVMLMYEYAKATNQRVVYWYKNSKGLYVFKIHPIDRNSEYVKKYMFTNENGDLIAYGEIFDEKPAMKQVQLTEEESKIVQEEVGKYGNLRPETIKKVRERTVEIKFTDSIITEDFIRTILPASGQEMSKPEIKKINDGLYVVELFNGFPQIMEFRTDAAYDVARIFEVDS